MEDEPSYFRRRAAEELAAAERANTDIVAQIHLSLAARMLAKAAGSPVHLAEAASPSATSSVMHLA